MHIQKSLSVSQSPPTQEARAPFPCPLHRELDNCRLKHAGHLVAYLDASAFSGAFPPSSPSVLHEGLFPLAGQGYEGAEELRPAALVLLPPLEDLGQVGMLPVQQTQTHGALLKHIQSARQRVCLRLLEQTG